MTADLPGDPDRDRHPTTDRVVFSVTAALTPAFVIWGATATESLEDVSSSMLNTATEPAGRVTTTAAPHHPLPRPHLLCELCEP
ncbi:hypothetical protein OG609_04770 [Streptomyces sp. NBC_01224]|uniref:hypothetical protein n=1 Tax=unclassified Streptomyces TaxID=2593676 RepID=UPI002E14CF79|nr:hypothetical protein OG609_04770 [Streptomyces sp. NBC_01224]